MGNAGPQGVVFLGVLEEIDDLGEIGLGLVAARHVAEIDLDLPFLNHVGFRFAELAGPAALVAACAAPHQQQHQPDQHQRQQLGDPAER